MYRRHATSAQDALLAAEAALRVAAAALADEPACGPLVREAILDLAERTAAVRAGVAYLAAVPPVSCSALREAA